MILGVVAPFDHKYELPELAVKTTLPPTQKLVAPFVVTVGVAALPLALTVVGPVVALQPFDPVTVTV